LHLITTLEPDGAQTQLLDLVRSSTDATFDMRIGYLAGSGSARAEYPDLAGRIIDFSGPGGRLDPFSIVKVAAHLRAGGYAIVHTHLVHAGVVGKLAARAARMRHVVGTRHYAYDDKQSSWLYRYEDRLLARTERVIAVSEAVRRHMIRARIVPEERIVVVANGVDTDRFDSASRPPAANPPIIGAAGRLHPQKGHMDLILAFREVAASHPTARLEILGEGRLRPELEGMVRDLGLAARVDLPGRIPHAEMPDRIARWTCCAMPSRWEAFGIAAAEAMALGKPVVAARIEGLTELVEDHETGFLFEAGDVAALAARLLELLGDPGAARHLGLRGAERVRKRFPIGGSVAALLDLYRMILFS
jgi:glycosyltransferase involved in cell wall biosynthesis